MKKILSVILALVLILAVTAPALATNSINNVVVGPNGYVTYNNGVLPYIEAWDNETKTWQPAGKYVDDYRGQRVAFTCRDFLFPKIEQDEKMSQKNWTHVETTPIKVRTIVPAGMLERDFAYQINNYDAGVIATHPFSGKYQFTITNGEIVIWMQDQLANANTDLLVRILHQAENGNFDVKHELAVKWITADIKALLPETFVEERGLKQMHYPTPTDWK